MSRSEKNIDENTKKKSSKLTDVPSADFLLCNIVEFGKYSFELQQKREESIINQSGNMLTAFSVVSAVMVMGIPLLIEHTVAPTDQILFCAGLSLLFLLISLVFATIAQWRFKYQSMDSVDAFYNSVINEFENYSSQAQFYRQWKAQLSMLHSSKKKLNDIRARLITASMVSFWFSIGIVIISSSILIALNL